MSNSFPEFTQPGKKPVINSIFDFSADALGELRLWLEQNPPAIGISNILGFEQFTMQASPLVGGALETTTSTTFVNLATVGPTLSGLSDGKYVVWLSNLSAIDTGGQQGIMALSINGAAADVTYSTEAWSSSFDNINQPFLLTLSNGSNSLVAKYKSSGGGTATFFKRQIFALRYANK